MGRNTTNKIITTLSATKQSAALLNTNNKCTAILKSLPNHFKTVVLNHRLRSFSY